MAIFCLDCHFDFYVSFILIFFDFQEALNKMERLDRNQWKQYQNIMQDTLKFVELLQAIEWEDGLSAEVIQAVESYLTKSKDDQLGLTGEGFLLENAKGLLKHILS